MSAQGDMLGLTGPVKMGATNTALSVVNNMRRSGAFDATNTRFGSINQAEALQQVGQLVSRGEASENAKSAGALIRAFETADPTSPGYAELEAAVTALKDPSKNGEYKAADGTIKNIHTELGKRGFSAAKEIADRAGISSQHFGSLFNDRNTQEYQPAGIGFMTQRAEFEKLISNTVTKSTLSAGLDAAGTPGALSAPGQRDVVATALSGLIIDSSNKDERSQIDHMLATSKKTFAEALKKETPKQETKPQEPIFIEPKKVEVKPVQEPIKEIKKEITPKPIVNKNEVHST
jgi:hypothetical protein